MTAGAARTPVVMGQMRKREDTPFHRRRQLPVTAAGNMNGIYSGASVRKYQDSPVAREKAEAVLRAAMTRPLAFSL